MKPKGFDTDEQHIAHGGGQCPQCGSGDIEGSEFQCSGEIMFQKVYCLYCGAAWQDRFTLTGYEVLEIGS